TNCSTPRCYFTADELLPLFTKSGTPLRDVILPPTSYSRFLQKAGLHSAMFTPKAASRFLNGQANISHPFLIRKGAGKSF
ncbi:MAG: hypothetical protein KDC66_05100, partial [Phaeodactylibacter sp.]|nr:hypothetical protein [Phaeodactylibacter sp.]